MWVPEPTALGVYVTEQLPLLNEQLAAGVKLPATELENDTVSVGVADVPLSVSVTVAVHVEP